MREENLKQEIDDWFGNEVLDFVLLDNWVMMGTIHIQYLIMFETFIASKIDVCYIGYVFPKM